MMLHVLHTTEPSLELSTVLQLHTKLTITRILCSLATWGNTKETPKVLTDFSLYIISLVKITTQQRNNTCYMRTK